jgi:hypothetical protein
VSPGHFVADLKFSFLGNKDFGQLNDSGRHFVAAHGHEKAA